MKTIAKVLIALIAAEHLGILIMEMFFWDHPVGRGVFNLTPEFSAKTAYMAMNQGLYNGFLAVGLLWGLLAKKRDVTVFFLLCVLVAGIFGAATVKSSILYVQAVPAFLALIAVWLSGKRSA